MEIKQNTIDGLVAMTHCEVVEIRNSADADGFPCSRTASTQCFDCGSELCESHAETCGICTHILSFVLVLPFSAALESRLSGSRTRSRTENEKGKPQFRHLLFRRGD